MIWLVYVTDDFYVGHDLVGCDTTYVYHPTRPVGRTLLSTGCYRLPRFTLPLHVVDVVGYVTVAPVPVVALRRIALDYYLRDLLLPFRN